MRKWKCIRTDKNWFRVNKIYESDDSGYCLKDELGYKWSCYKMWEIKEYVEFEELKEVTEFTKSDLQELDIVILGDENRYVYFKGCFITPKSNDRGIHTYREDLTRMSFKRDDVMQVYRNGQLIFKREEQSQRDIKIKELQDKMDAIKREMEELK